MVETKPANECGTKFPHTATSVLDSAAGKSIVDADVGPNGHAAA
jgi:hypothetical protein